jgi:hypothetical protein
MTQAGRRRIGVAALVLLAVLAAACVPTAVTLGSTGSRLGRDPAKQSTGFWLNIAGPLVSKAIGDRFTAGRCEVGEVNCSAGGENLEYHPDGAFTQVDVNGPARRRPLVIRAFDPAFLSTGDLCDTNMASATTSPSLAQIAAAYPDDTSANVRYAGGPTPYCAGDTLIQGPAPTTTYIVRAPDATPLDDTDNPIICAISFSPRQGPIGPLLLNPDGTPNTTTVGALDGLPLSAVFHKDVTICSVPPAQLVEGTYLVQVRTDALDPAGVAPTTVADPGLDPVAESTVARQDPTIATGGHNRYSLLAAWSVGRGSSTDGVHVYDTPNAAVFINSPDLGTPNLVPLATVTTAAAGHALHLSFWDIGDWGNANLRIEGPPGFAGAAVCTWTVDGVPLAAAGTSATATGCAVTGLTRGTGFPAVGGFNGRLLEVLATVPAGYRCATATKDGCLVSAAITYTSGVPDDPTNTPADTLTISAAIN